MQFLPPPIWVVSSMVERLVLCKGVVGSNPSQPIKNLIPTVGEMISKKGAATVLDPDDPELTGQGENRNRSSKPPTEGDLASERITTPRTPPAMTTDVSSRRA